MQFACGYKVGGYVDNVTYITFLKSRLDKLTEKRYNNTATSGQSNVREVPILSKSALLVVHCSTVLQ